MTRSALALAIATLAMAQSTIVMPQLGSNGYAVIPPRWGFTTQVLPMPGGGWMIVPQGAQGRSTTVLPLPGDGSASTVPRRKFNPARTNQCIARGVRPTALIVLPSISLSP